MLAVDVLIQRLVQGESFDDGVENTRGCGVEVLFERVPAALEPLVRDRAPFTDVAPAEPFYREITWLDSRHIATGWTEPDGTKTFHPSEPVARNAMAAFFFRLYGNLAYTAPAISPFTDVSPSSPFYKEIAWLASVPISTGSNRTAPGPSDPATR